MNNAPNIPRENFFAMTALDENRAKHQLAAKAGVPVDTVKNMVIWGNHSNTQFADYKNAIINGKPASESIDETWLKSDFLETVGERGAAVINARGMSSAASAANAIIKAWQNLETPTPQDELFSMALCSDGSYGVPKGLICSFPARNVGGNIEIVQNLMFDDFGREKFNLTVAELEEEKAMVEELL
jgi:malate dehydrogenase